MAIGVNGSGDGGDDIGGGETMLAIIKGGVDGAGNDRLGGETVDHSDVESMKKS